MAIETIAEITTNHMGNLNVLLRMVNRAVEAGASWIKMQKKDVATFYTAEKLDTTYRSPYGHTYREYREIFEFAKEDWWRFDARCKQRGIPWFCTVQDMPSLEFMLTFDLPRYKVASSNARNERFLREVARCVPDSCEIVISVGGSTLQEIEAVLNIFDEHRRIWLLHCVAEYPCPPERLRLGNIVELRRRFGGERVKIGYSGHEEGIAASLHAGRLGAEMIERHFCLSRYSFVHHNECSLEPAEFATMVQLLNDGGVLSRFPLPEAAYKSSFGMSDVERWFLVEQSYGNQFLAGGKSEF